jgi:pseudouridine synthase
MVNGSVVREPSHPVDPCKDTVVFEKRRMSLKEKIYILLNKPKGVTTTKKDRFAQRTVMDILPAGYKHLFPVGRLDKDTEGLLIMTNDGDFSYKLTHPSFAINKVYVAKLDRDLSPDHRIRLEAGVSLDDELTAPCQIVNLGEKEVKITIHEGRKRQIRRMFALFRYKVAGLKRVSVGSLNLGDLPVGRWREISDKELAELDLPISK